MIALKNAPTMTPVRRSTRTSSVRATRAVIRRTEKMASKAPTKAASGNAQGERADHPRTTAPTAPTAAPPETPSTYGSAKGFRSSA